MSCSGIAVCCFPSGLICHFFLNKCVHFGPFWRLAEGSKMNTFLGCTNTCGFKWCVICIFMCNGSTPSLAHFPAPVLGSVSQ